MEMYRKINHGLTMQNQELRQTVAVLKEETIILNRKLMAETEAKNRLRRQIVQIVSEASASFHKIIREINPLEQIQALNESRISEGDASGAPHTLMNSSGKSVRLVQPIVRQTIGNSDTNKENTSPLDADERISYVQMRKRRPAEVSNEEMEAETSNECLQDSAEAELSSDDANMEEDDDEADENTKDDDEVDENTLKELSQKSVTSLNREIPTIVEENTIDITNSDTRCSIRNNRHISRSVINNSSRNQNTIIPDEINTLNIPQISQSIISSSSQNQNNTISEDLLFDNFSVLKATSSTPYKRYSKKTEEHMRNAYVLLKKMKPGEIKLYDISTDDRNLKRSTKSHKSVTKSNFKKKPQEELPKSPSRQILLERSINIPAETTNGARPKRQAAPVNLKEPRLGTKLRRNRQ